MDTAAINYRVADFLKKYPPFQVMKEEDLLQLASKGRVKFFEANQYVLMRGAQRVQVIVIQQGTVLVWDERGAEARLLDVRGPGDLLGIDQFNEGRPNTYAARSAGDVLIYAFPAEEFDALILKYPDARQYVAAYGSVKDYRSSQERRAPHNVLLRELAAGRNLPVCNAAAGIRETAQYMLKTGSEAVLVQDSKQGALGILTARTFLEWIANGQTADEPVSTLIDGAPIAMPHDSSVADGVLRMSATGASALAIAPEHATNGRVKGIVTTRDLGLVFGDRPDDILRGIRYAPDVQTLRELNERARSLVLQYLTTAASSDWLTAFTSSIDKEIVQRVIAMTVPQENSRERACWCFCGSSGRGESPTMLAPQIVAIIDDRLDQSSWLHTYERVLESTLECGYLPNPDKPFDTPFFAAGAAEWTLRYLDWVRDPILKEISRGRSLFDLRPIHGDASLWQKLNDAVTAEISNEFLHVLANDCLETLPPLTFFQNAVVDETGEETAVFRLEDSALRPLVDVGRVFGMAARKVFGTSTLERFFIASRILPGHASIFEEASETLRLVLWQQGRIGISQRTAGLEVPPSLLGRYDQQRLKSGFRAISKLLEFTADPEWLKSL